MSKKKEKNNILHSAGLRHLLESNMIQLVVNVAVNIFFFLSGLSFFLKRDFDYIDTLGDRLSGAVYAAIKEIG